MHNFNSIILSLPDDTEFPENQLSPHETSTDFYHLALIVPYLLQELSTISIH